MATAYRNICPLSVPLVIVPLLAIALFCTVPVSSTSRKALEGKSVRNGFRVTLKHVDASKNLTVLERIQRWTKRGHRRVQRLNAMLLAGDDGVQAPVHAGNGEFLMELSIGTPPTSYHAIVDTGSDLIWTQCEPCKECYEQDTPIFDPKKSSSFSKIPCSNSLCEALPQSSCAKGESCEYLYTYGDYSSTQGILATETFKFGDVLVPSVGFGCGGDNQGDGFTQGEGLVGLGRGPLSLVSQLKEPKFSYCLNSIGDTKSTSTLLMGSLANINANNTSSDNAVITTPLIKNPVQPSFYYLSLEGISVGTIRLSMKESTFTLQEDGKGGLIIDSGTTITYLEDRAYSMVRKEFVAQTKLDVDESASTGLDLCFKVPPGSTEVKVPKLVFHFDGGDLELPGENYMVGDSNEGVLCLAMGSSNGMSIFGNIQQQNILVLHDLEKETVSFVPSKCDRL